MNTNYLIILSTIRHINSRVLYQWFKIKPQVTYSYCYLFRVRGSARSNGIVRISFRFQAKEFVFFDRIVIFYERVNGWTL